MMGRVYFTSAALLIIAALLLGFTIGQATAARTSDGATVQAYRPSKVLGTMFGQGTVIKRTNEVDRVDVRLIRNSVQMAYRTFLVPRRNFRYTAGVSYRCTRPLRAGLWQTQIRSVTRVGFAGPWSTSQVRSATC